MKLVYIMCDTSKYLSLYSPVDTIGMYNNCTPKFLPICNSISSFFVIFTQKVCVCVCVCLLVVIVCNKINSTSYSF